MASPPTKDAQEISDSADKVIDSAKSYLLGKVLPYVVGAGVVILLIAAGTSTSDEENS
jgi:hypothetical protein